MLIVSYVALADATLAFPLLALGQAEGAQSPDDAFCNQCRGLPPEGCRYWGVRCYAARLGAIGSCATASLVPRHET